MIRGNVKELLSLWRRGRGCGSAVGILDQLSRFLPRIRAGLSAGEPRHPRSPVTAPQAGTVGPPAPALALHSLVAALMLAFAALVPGEVLAQTAYVTNTGQTNASLNAPVASNQDQAQQFTTGPQSGGYALAAIGLTSSNSPGRAGLRVRLFTSSGGIPGTALHTLQNPSTLTADTEAIFKPNSAVTLDPSTSYFIVVQKSSSPTLSLRLQTPPL